MCRLSPIILGLLDKAPPLFPLFCGLCRTHGLGEEHLLGFAVPRGRAVRAPMPALIRAPQLYFLFLPAPLCQTRGGSAGRVPALLISKRGAPIHSLELRARTFGLSV